LYEEGGRVIKVRRGTSETQDKEKGTARNVKEAYEGKCMMGTEDVVARRSH
jgi:hypothetical protein